MANYEMKAYNANLGRTVFWPASGAPDKTGASSPYDIGDLSGIVVAYVKATSGTTPGEAGGVYFEIPMSLVAFDPMVSQTFRTRVSSVATSSYMSEYTFP